MKARLALYKDGELISSFPLPEPGTTIGRDEDNHIRFNHPKVSRHHAAVHAKDNMWLIKDLDSTNGLVVNGVRVEHAVLKKGDRVGIGPFELVFECIPKDSEWGPMHGIDLMSDSRRSTITEHREPGGPKTVQS